MAGVFDTIANALNGHTTSGMDAAMSAHADKLHPVNSGAGVQQKNSSTATNSLKRRADGSMILPLDGDYKP